MTNNDVSPKRVLVVEDEPAISNVCQRVLVGAGFEVATAANGEIAQDMIERQQYDLFLIDIRTPAMDGKELYRWLEGKHPQLVGRVVFTTGDVMGGDTQRFLEKAARPFLPKPFAPDELKAIIKKTWQEITK